MSSRNIAPYSRGRGLSGFDPLLDLHREMNRLFNDAFSGGSLADVRSGALSVPKLDVREKDGELCVVAELPGVSQQDLDIQLDKDVLTIRGERKNETEEENASYYLMERSYGRFERSVQLPFMPKPDEVKARFENGVLTIRMPRSQEQGAHRIPLAAAQEGQQAATSSTGTTANQAAEPSTPDQRH